MSLPKVMRAVGIYKYLPLNNPKCLQDVQIPVPNLLKQDCLVQVKAISVNPIDTKIRSLTGNIENAPKILGWDGAGVVVAKGEAANIFNVGDEVIFTGDVRRNGANAQYVALNEFLIGPKPKNLSFDEAGAMPLTAVTAYETLFDRLILTEKDAGKTILIVNSAGGVGSLATQMAKNLGMKVIGTASRPESVEFSQQNGASLVLNHRNDLIEELKKNQINQVDYILVNYDPALYWDAITTAIKPQGRICLIVDASQKVDVRALKDKSVTLVSMSMLTRIKYDVDVDRHHEILRIVSKMFEDRKLTCTLKKTLSPFNAETLKEAHRLMEQQVMVGKLVVNGF